MKEINIKNIFSKYKFSIALALLLLVVLGIFLHNHINIVFAGVNICFVFSFLLLLGKIGNRIIGSILIFTTSFILSLGITFALLFSAPLGVGNIASIFETNFSEAISLGINVYLLGLICLLTTTILCFKAINELKWLFSGQNIGFVLLGLIIFINVSAVAVPVYRNSGFLLGYKKDLRELPLQTIYAFSSMRSPLLYGDIFGLAVYSYEKLDFWRFQNIEKNEPKGVTSTNSEKSAPTIYLVIGESAYRGRMSLYGYNEKTTPFLDSIAKVDSSSINYYEAISIANITRDAIRFSLSFASPWNRDAFWKEKNIVDLANDAGYRTSWLSNQGLAGLYDNYPSYIARSSKETYFESKMNKDDLDLLSILDNHHEKGEKQFIAMHLMGSHFPFNERYDENDEKVGLTDDYDKSIHHTDRFLKALYDYTKMKDESSIIVYFSDHGAAPERGVHGLSHAEDSEYEIPLVIINNGTALQIDFIISKYKREYTDYVNSLSMSYILSELMGYSVDFVTIHDAVYQSLYVMQVDGTTIEFEKKGERKQ